MKSLFLRIFLWFWLVMAVVVGLLVVLSPAWTRVRPAFARWEQHAFARLTHEAEMAARLLLEAGPEAMRERTGRHGPAPLSRLYLIDSSGRDVYGQEISSQARALAERASASGRTEFERDGMAFRLARPVAIAGGDEFVLVMIRGPGRPGQRRGPPRAIELLEPRVLLPVLGLIVLIVGALSFWLARYLTGPLAVLRTATLGLSEGELSTRVGGSVARRRDEIGGLARDFDHMAERLEVLIGAQRRLLRDVSHELRSPLARLEVALELARNSAGGGAEQHLDRIDRESERLNDLIEKLLTLERLESGASGRGQSTVDIPALLDEIADDASFEARTRGCEVSLLAGPACTIDGAPELLRSAIENVVRNAIAYTAEDTAVEISHSVGDDPRCVRIVVRDQGPGIPDDDLENIFQPFHRVADARDRKSGGSGLGLAITDRAVRLHGGRVTARNHPDGGLEITIALPADNGPSLR
jgi:two-component system sensor histidine kinase CpxA